MDAPSTGFTPQIALRSFTAGGHPYEGGDRFDDAKAIDDGLTVYNVDNLKKQKFVGPLSRTSYEIAIGRRPPGSIGRGFKPEWLVEQGIIDEVPKAAAAKPVTVAAAPVVPGEPIPHRGCRVIPIKQGNFTRFEPQDSDGRPMRAKRFQKLEAAIAFIDEKLGPVVGEAEHVDDAAEAEGAGEGQSDGDDVQSGAEHRHLESTD